MKAILPISGPKPKYYEVYIGYLRGILEAAGVKVELRGKHVDRNITAYEIIINGRKIIYDPFNHYQPIMRGWDGCPYFKTHFNSAVLAAHHGMIGFSPTSFWDWKQYEVLSSEVRYRAEGPVLCMQNPHGHATERRKQAQMVIGEHYKSQAIIHWNVSQASYWRMAGDCLTHVFMPGARWDILDKGQLQYMAFGCCTISPRISDELPFAESWSAALMPGEHYIECRRDMADLLDCIEWIRSHPVDAIEIGQNAKNLFGSGSTPEWLMTRIRGAIHE